MVELEQIRKLIREEVIPSMDKLESKIEKLHEDHNSLDKKVTKINTLQMVMLFLIASVAVPVFLKWIGNSMDIITTTGL